MNESQSPSAIAHSHGRAVSGARLSALLGALLFACGLWASPICVRAQSSDLRTIEAVETVRMRLPQPGVRGIHWYEGRLLLLITENMGLSAPDSSYRSALVEFDPDTAVADTLRLERDVYETGLTSGIVDELPALWSGGSLLGGAAALYQLDPASGAILLSLPAPGHHPGGLAWDGSHLWQVDADARKIFRMEPEEAKVSRKTATPGFYPTGLAHDGFHFWCADAATGRLYRLKGFNGVADAVVSEEAYSRPGEFVSLAWDGDALWCVGAADSVAVRLELLR